MSANSKENGPVKAPPGSPVGSDNQPKRSTADFKVKTIKDMFINFNSDERSRTNAVNMKDNHKTLNKLDKFRDLSFQYKHQDNEIDEQDENLQVKPKSAREVSFPKKKDKILNFHLPIQFMNRTMLKESNNKYGKSIKNRIKPKLNKSSDIVITKRSITPVIQHISKQNRLNTKIPKPHSNYKNRIYQENDIGVFNTRIAKVPKQKAFDNKGKITSKGPKIKELSVIDNINCIQKNLAPCINQRIDNNHKGSFKSNE